jgi:hypothetical protein
MKSISLADPIGRRLQQAATYLQDDFSPPLTMLPVD